jgi:hypothetical protein
MQQEEKRLTFKQKLNSRNFWNFAIAATISTAVFFYLLGKCKGIDGDFNHEAAYRYFDMWGSTIALFVFLFSGNNILKEAVGKMPRMGGPSGGV